MREFGAGGNIRRRRADARARIDPASVLPTYALNTCANFTLVGTTYGARGVRAIERRGEGRADERVGGVGDGGGAMWAYRGRGGAVAGCGLPWRLPR